ncbi:hypothetical protein Rhopal_006834-T1 [Rhodotorula paludigena]|uniref:Uncharacterized protein n=1 Tax=Rhodotorula paludigena TaxID=86838 RepID=A0AAV5GW98_9BASI|nr:hypothetical protein Rhopal_006834-T1 [Rhodotorula paludigena]
MQVRRGSAFGRQRALADCCGYVDASHAVASAGPASTSQQKIAYGKAPQGHHVNLDVVVPASPAVESVTFGATNRLNHGRPPGMEANKRPGVLPPAKVATNPGRAADPYDTDRRHPVTETPAKPPTTRASLPAAASPPVQSSAGLAAASAAKSPLSAASPTPRLASRRSDDSSEISSAAAETPVRGSGAGERMDVGKEEKGVAVKEEGMRARLRPRRSIGASSAGDSSSSAQKYARDSDAGVADEDKPSSSSSDDDQLSSASSDDDDTHPPLPLPVPYYAKLLTVFRHATIRAVEAKEADLPAGSHRGRLLGRIINEQLELQPDFEQPMPVPVPGRPKVPIKQLALWASKNGGGWIKALPKLGYKIVVNSEYGSHRVRKNLRARLKASAWYRNGMDTKQWTLDLTDEEQMFWLAAFESEALTFQKV